MINKIRNRARMAIVKMLMCVEWLNEFRTGKRCIAKLNFAWNIGIGYHRRIEQDALVEFYIFPFALVTITTFNLGIISTLDTELEYQINRTIEQ